LCKVALKRARFLPVVPIGPNGDIFPHLSLWVSVTKFLATLYIIQPIPYFTHFDPEDGGSMLLRNIDELLQYYTTSQAGIA
jgi:hypothetical protein